MNVTVLRRNIDGGRDHAERSPDMQKFNAFSAARFGAAAFALAASVTSANAADFDFSYSLTGAEVATGSFSFADGLTGVLGYNDLSAFSVTASGVTYSLADVLPLTSYKNFGYDTAANAFVIDPNSCGFGGCGFQSSLSAINSSGTFGFFFTAAPGSFQEYSTQTGSAFDTITISAVDGAVPEPSTWAMMLVGFGAIGFAMRRKPRQTVRINFA